MSNLIRKILLFISFTLLFLMVVSYLLNQLDISDWLGTLGFGILTVTLLTYISTLIKDGYVEKF